MVTFFAGLGVSPVESLAVLPVVNSLAFIFRAPGLSFQEVVISFLARSRNNFPPLRRFAGILAGFSSAGLMAIAFTPLAGWWFQDVSGLSQSLASFASNPTRVIAFIPALTVLLVWQRSVLVHDKKTGPITWASAIEVSLILASMMSGLFLLKWNGALSATVSYLIGRLGACAYMEWKRRLS